MSGLPTWMWDLLADLIDEEDVHPKLYAEMFNVTAGKHEWTRYNWCPSVPLKHVPVDVLANARAIAAYRSAQRGGEEENHG